MLEKQNIYIGVGLLLFTSFITSTTLNLVKLIGLTYSITIILLFQYFVCFACQSIWTIKSGIPTISKRRIPLHILRSTVGLSSYFAFYSAVQLISLTNTTLFRYLAPLWVPVLLFLFAKFKATGILWAALSISFIGVVVVLKPSSGIGIGMGELYAIATGILLALSMIITRKLSETEPTSAITFYYYITATLIIAPFALTELIPDELQIMDIIWLLVLGIMLFLSLTTYNLAYKYASSSELAPVFYMGIVFAVMYDWLAWDQLPTLSDTLGGLLIIAGGILGITRKARRN